MRWRRVLAGVLGTALAAGLVCGGLLVWTFSGLMPLADAEVAGGQIVKDGYVGFGLLDAGPGAVALLDLGNDPEGVALKAALAHRGIRPEDVTTILLTHGHPDHVSACPLFPNATTYVGAAELPSMRGEVGFHSPLTRWFPPADKHCAKLVGVADGDTVPLGDGVATYYAVPGHTAGSGAWLVEDVLWVGDAADVLADGTVVNAKWLFTDDPAQSRRSWQAVVARLPTGIPRQIAPAHSGLGTGDALRRFAAP